MDMDEKTSLMDGPTPCVSMQKICYGFGHVYNDLCAAVWFSYTLFYFQIILEMDATTAGTLIMIGQVADSMATAGAGWAVDWIGTPRAWHLTGTCIVAAGFSFLFSLKPSPSHWWYLLYYGGHVVLFQIGWAVVQISHLSIITKIARNNEHSADLTAIRYTASVCCNIFVYVITWAVLRSDGAAAGLGPDDFYKFKEIILVVTGVGLVCSAVFYCGINYKDTHEILGEQELTPAIGESVAAKSFLKSLVTYQVSLMYMASRLYTTINLIYIPLYLDQRIAQFNQGTESIRGAIASVPLVCFLASFFSSLLLKNRPTIFNDKIVYTFGAIISLIGCLWITLGISEGSDAQVYIVATIIGIGGSATMVTSLCLTAQFVNTNGFKGGSVYSTVTFTDKIISGAVVFIIQNVECHSKDGCPNFYGMVLGYATGSAALVGLISLLTLQCHNPKMLHIRNHSVHI